MLEICYHIYNALLIFLFYVSPSLRLTEAGTGVQDILCYLLKFFIQVDLKVIEPKKVWQVNSHTDSDSFKCFGTATISTPTVTQLSREMPHWGLYLSRTEDL